MEVSPLSRSFPWPFLFLLSALSARSAVNVPFFSFPFFVFLRVLRGVILLNKPHALSHHRGDRVCRRPCRGSLRSQRTGGQRHRSAIERNRRTGKTGRHPLSRRTRRCEPGAASGR